MQRKRSTPSRRSFLQVGGLLGLTLPKLLRAEAATPSAKNHRPAKNMIMIWLDGGPSTVDMWDLKPNAPESIRGEFAAISTSVAGLPICEHLPGMAKVMHKCTIIRSLKHNIPAHGPGSQYVMTGHLPSAVTEYPSLGSVTARMRESAGGIPPYVTFGNPPYRGAGYLGSAWNAFELGADARTLPDGVSLGAEADMVAFERRIKLRNVFDHRFDDRKADRIAQGLGAFQQQAVDVLRRDSIRRAIDIETTDDTQRELYGATTIGLNAIRARRLVESGVRFVTIGMSGWDTHVNNFTTLRNNLLPQLDKALAGLIFDLDRRGMLDDTIVCCCGEFGRTPQVNETAGRDHWSSAMSLLLAGGGIREGFVHGATDKWGMTVTDNPMNPADLAATLLWRLGIDPTTVTRTPSGRTMPIVRDGTIVADLFAAGRKSTRSASTGRIATCRTAPSVSHPA